MARRKVDVQSSKIEQIIVDFNKLKDILLPEVDDVYCCLGTTIKKAKTKEAFRKVDLDYPILIGEKAYQNGATHYLVVSSIGANENSPFFYSRVKGELERKLGQLGFERVTIVRPSLLLGERHEKRVGEGLATKISQWFPILFRGPFKVYEPVEGKVVAATMIEAAFQEGEALQIIERQNMR